MDSGTRMLEEAGLNAWPALRSTSCGGWVLRFAEGYTKRANSANALSPEAPFPTILRTAETLYPANGLPVVFRLTPLAGGEPDVMLERAGYRRVDESLVMTADIAELPGTPTGSTVPAVPDPAVSILPVPDEAWRDGHAGAAALSPGNRRLHAAILSAIGPPAAFATLSGEDGPAAFGFAVAEGTRIGLFGVVTLPGWRRRGAAKRLVSALLAWGRSKGATTAYLQVGKENDAAIGLYAGLGFGEAYRYHYRIRP